jgi:GH15 family glucan-1,4-alpha-glucosidase
MVAEESLGWSGDPGDPVPPSIYAAKARQLFGGLLAHCHDVGLLSEELDPLTGRMLGNFPQAYSPRRL